MTLDEFFGIGVARTIGEHLFQADEIREFAARYDPQPFHLDEEAARRSVLGGLCASGWHTAAMFAHLDRRDRGAAAGKWRGKGPAPEFGASSGFDNLKWLKPVYAGQTITFSRTGISHRPVPLQPGQVLFSFRGEAFNPKGEKVFEFESTVPVKVGAG